MNQKVKRQVVLLTFSFDSCLYSCSIFIWIKISCRDYSGVGGIARLKYAITKNAVLEFGLQRDVGKKKEFHLMWTKPTPKLRVS